MGEQQQPIQPAGTCPAETANATPVDPQAMVLLRQEAALEAADMEWRRGVRAVTPAGAHRVDEYASISHFDDHIVQQGINWCGFFLGYSLYSAGLDRDLSPGFNHVENVEHFFNYTYEPRVPRFVNADNGWEELRDMHRRHGTERRWMNQRAFRRATLQTLDLRPGDIGTMDIDGNNTPDHIIMVRSYDPATGILETIEGNSRGSVVVPPTQNDPAPRTTTYAGQGTVVAVNRYDLNQPDVRRKFYGFGRFSIDDFRDYGYAQQRPAGYKNQPPRQQTH